MHGPFQKYGASSSRCLSQLRLEPVVIDEYRNPPVNPLVSLLMTTGKTDDCRA